MDLTSTYDQQDPARHYNDFITGAELLSDMFTSFAPEKTCITLVDISRLAFLPIGKTLPAPFHSLLSKREQTQLAVFTFEKRYREWLGGRLAAKLCLKKLQQEFKIPPQPLQTLSITADDHGRPRITPELSLPVDISISHSHQYATAIAALNQRVGIDIEKISPRIAKVAERFTSPEENRLLANAESLLHGLTIIWASKEAIKKQLLHDQPTLFSGITIKSASSHNKERWRITCDVEHQGWNKRVSVKVDIFEAYVLAVATGEEHA